MKTIQFDSWYLYHVLGSSFLIMIFVVVFLQKYISKLGDCLATWIEKKMELNEKINREKFNSNFGMTISLILAFLIPIFFFDDLKSFNFEESGLKVTVLPFGETEIIAYDNLEFVYMANGDLDLIPGLDTKEEFIRIKRKDTSEMVYFLRSFTNDRLAEKYYPIHVVNPNLITTADVHKLYQWKFEDFVHSLNDEIERQSKK